MAKKKPRARQGSQLKRAKHAGPKKKPAVSATRSRILTILIAVVFWGVVWGLLSLRDRGISEARQNRHRAYETRLFLREIENALASYQEERGAVPPCRDETRGGAVLFEKLLSGTRRYLGPRPDRIRHGKTADEPTVIIDTWGDPIRYRTGAHSSAAVTANPQYDLWSTGGNPMNPREKWITAQ